MPLQPPTARHLSPRRLPVQRKPYQRLVRCCQGYHRAAPDAVAEDWRVDAAEAQQQSGQQRRQQGCQDVGGLEDVRNVGGEDAGVRMRGDARSRGGAGFWARSTLKTSDTEERLINNDDKHFWRREKRRLHGGVTGYGLEMESFGDGSGFGGVLRLMGFRDGKALLERALWRDFGYLYGHWRGVGMVL